MDYRRIISAAVAAVACLAPGASSAQSIVEAVRAGLDNSPNLQAERARLSGLMEQQVQARNLRRPSLQLEATTSLRQRAVLQQTGRYDVERSEPGSVSLNATQPLMLGGRYQTAMREADLRVGRSTARIRSQELTVVRQVIEAYANVRRDFQIAAIRSQGVVWLSQQLTGAQLRQSEGLVGLTEVSQVETRLANARGSASIAQARLQSSWATLERFLGEKPTGLTDDSINPVGLPATLTEAVDLAQVMSHEIKAARFNEDIARAVARTAQTESAPRVNLQASVSGASDIGFNGGRNYDAQIGARLVVPLWNGGQPQSRERAALFEANAARLEAVAAERLLTEQVTQAWANLEAARNAASIAEELVRAAQVARTGAELEFDIGLRSIIEVLNQEQELQEAKVNLETTKSNLMTTQAVLFNLLGLDPTGVVTQATQFDPTRMNAPFSSPLPGKLAPWERPLVTVFEILDDVQINTQPTVRSVKKAIFGPEL
jgi:outer membrane protein